MIEYKGYTCVYEFDEKRTLFYGKVTNCDNLITFQGKPVKETKENFQEAVDQYLAWCKKYRNAKERPHGKCTQ